jgi:hypothetical protein
MLCSTALRTPLYHYTTALQHYTALHCSSAPPRACTTATASLHCITPLTASLVITSLHHSTIHASASLHTSLIHYNITALHTPLHCLTNSSTPFHSITAPLATSLLCTTACTTATASLHCITTPPCHCITPPTHHCSTASLQFFHPTAARHCSTPLHCLTDSSIPLHHITALQRTSLLCTTVCPTANAHCTKLKAITKTLNKEDKHKGPVNLKKWWAIHLVGALSLLRGPREQHTMLTMLLALLFLSVKKGFAFRRWLQYACHLAPETKITQK